jgi:hypothetical protein
MLDTQATRGKPCGGEMGEQRFLRAYRITREADFQRDCQRRLTAGDHVMWASNRSAHFPRLRSPCTERLPGKVTADQRGLLM